MLCIALLSLSAPSPVVNEAATATLIAEPATAAKPTTAAGLEPIIRAQDYEKIADRILHKLQDTECKPDPFKVCECTCNAKPTANIVAWANCDSVKSDLKKFESDSDLAVCDKSKYPDCSALGSNLLGAKLTNIEVTCSGSIDNSCFAKDSTTACLLSTPTAECEHVLMADLVAGDLVLGREGATTVVAVQHKAVDTRAEMLTFHTVDGSAVSMTPNHAIFADGALVAAADVTVGAALSTGAVESITRGESNIINVVTSSGTIVADGVLAASNPYWLASLTIDAPFTRAVVNAVLFAVGDVDSVAAGCAKVAATLAGAALAVKALRSRKPSA